ncbi:NUDIX hydrolase [Candidatus Woesearchaeota archaeon]|nr:NUDIX hydrolase [Candidatus Woesearchaeota archaeon]
MNTSTMEFADLACAIIFNSFGEILLQKKDVRYWRYPGIWSFFGGAIENGETPKEAVIRELQEELGITFEDLKLFNVCEYEDLHPQQTRRGKLFTFVARHDGKQTDIRLNEGAGFAFFSREEVLSLHMIPYTKKLVLDSYNEIEKCGSVDKFVQTSEIHCVESTCLSSLKERKDFRGAQVSQTPTVCENLRIFEIRK